MRCKSGASQPKATPQVRNMLWVVQNAIVKATCPSEITVFTVSEEDILDNLIYQIRRDCPSLVADREALVRRIVGV